MVLVLGVFVEGFVLEGVEFVLDEVGDVGYVVFFWMGDVVV